MACTIGTRTYTRFGGRLGAPERIEYTVRVIERNGELIQYIPDEYTEDELQEQLKRLDRLYSCPDIGRDDFATEEDYIRYLDDGSEG